MNHIQFRWFPLKKFNSLIILLILLVESKCDKARFESFNYTYDREFLNVSGEINSKGILNIDGHLLKRLNSIYIYSLTTFRKNNDTKVLFNHSFNYCKLVKTNSASPFVLAFLLLVKKVSNVSMACPVKPGIYSIHEFDLKDLKFPPGRLLGIPRNLENEIIATRDPLKNEKPNRDNGKMFVSKVTAKIRIVP